MKKIIVIIGIAFLAFILGRFSTNPRSEIGENAHSDELYNDETHVEDDVEYVCPMHPQIRQKEPGTCPICFMDLVVVNKDASGGDNDTMIRLSESAKRLARVQTETVSSQPLSHSIDVFGRIAVAETNEIDLTAWVDGRIEKLYANTVGKEIKRGERMARLYSPELVVAQRTALQALAGLERAQSTEGSARYRALEASYQASINELRLLGMTARQIDRLIAEQEPQEYVDIFAVASGTIRARARAEGDYVKTGDRIVSIAALDSVWVQLEIYERDLGFITVGTPVRIQVPALGNREYTGRIDFIDPTIDRNSRVARARVVLPNDDGQLRPGAYVKATLEPLMPEQSVLSVPITAVLWTGQRSFVYRYDDSLESPAYVAVQVSLGQRLGDRYIIEDGLKEGDQVVVNGAFRIDASLQIKGGLSMMNASTDQLAPGDTVERVDVPPEGVEFAPPIQPEQLPDDVWYCDMGTVHWAQSEEGDGICPLCNMRLTHKHSADTPDTEIEEGIHEH